MDHVINCTHITHATAAILLNMIETIYLLSLRKLVSQLRCGCLVLVVSELPVK